MNINSAVDMFKTRVAAAGLYLNLHPDWFNTLTREGGAVSLLNGLDAYKPGVVKNDPNEITAKLIMQPGEEIEYSQWAICYKEEVGHTCLFIENDSVVDKTGKVYDYNELVRLFEKFEDSDTLLMMLNSAKAEYDPEEPANVLETYCLKFKLLGKAIVHQICASEWGNLVDNPSTVDFILEDVEDGIYLFQDGSLFGAVYKRRFNKGIIFTDEDSNFVLDGHRDKVTSSEIKEIFEYSYANL